MLGLTRRVAALARAPRAATARALGSAWSSPSKFARCESTAHQPHVDTSEELVRAQHAVISTFDLFSIGGTALLQLCPLSLCAVSGAQQLAHRRADARGAHLCERRQRAQFARQGASLRVRRSRILTIRAGSHRQDHAVRLGVISPHVFSPASHRYGSLAATGKGRAI